MIGTIIELAGVVIGSTGKAISAVQSIIKEVK